MIKHYKIKPSDISSINSKATDDLIFSTSADLFRFNSVSGLISDTEYSSEWDSVTGYSPS